MCDTRRQLGQTQGGLGVFIIGVYRAEDEPARPLLQVLHVLNGVSKFFVSLVSTNKARDGFDSDWS